MIANYLRKIRCRVRALLGRDIVIPVAVARTTEFHGSTCGGWSIAADSLTAADVVYSFGIGEDATFDLSLIGKYRCPVFAFDPTPKSVDFVEREIHTGLFHFEPSALADRDGMLRLFFPANPAFVSSSLAPSERTSESFFDAPCHTLASIMARLGHARVNVLKMDIEGAEYCVIEEAAASGTLTQVDQLLVEFHHWMPPFSPGHTRRALTLLLGAGFQVAWVSAGGHEVLFIRAVANHGY